MNIIKGQAQKKREYRAKIKANEGPQKEIIVKSLEQVAPSVVKQGGANESKSIFMYSNNFYKVVEQGAPSVVRQSANESNIYVCVIMHA